MLRAFLVVSQNPCLFDFRVVVGVPCIVSGFLIVR